MLLDLFRIKDKEREQDNLEEYSADEEDEEKDNEKEEGNEEDDEEDEIDYNYKVGKDGRKSGIEQVVKKIKKVETMIVLWRK